MQETIAITKNMTIGELVQKYPSVAEILQGEGVHCVGCGASYYETIEEGLSGHGRSEEEIMAIVTKMNEAIPREEGTDDLIITEKAVLKLKVILAEKQKAGLRISVLPGGCAGFSYEFSLAERKKENDLVVEISGVTLFVDAQSMEKLKGAKVDYVDSLTGAGFKISNPNASKTCGCGSSFR